MNRRYRYLVVEHKKDSKVEFDHRGAFKGNLPIHNLLGSYHWHRLNDDYVIVIGDYPMKNHTDLVHHPKTLVLPPLGSSRSIHAHSAMHRKETHGHALVQALKLTSDSSIEDVIEALENSYGPVFTSPR